MAAVNITSGNGDVNVIAPGARVVVRNSSGIPYVVVENSTDDSIDVWKGNSSTPTSFTEQDTSNNPSGSIYGSPSAAIDTTGVIHIVYQRDNGKTSTCRYVTFSTSTDTFSGDVVIDSNIGADPISIQLLLTAITVDSNDIPHVVYTRYDSGMGTNYFTISYNNRIGGAWNGSSVEIDGASNSIGCKYPDITVNTGDAPVIAYQDDTNNYLKRAVGNANDATSFTLTTLDTSVSLTPDGCSVCVTSEGSIWCATRDGDGSIILYQGTTVRDTGNAGGFVSIAASGSNVYVFYRDSNDDIAYDIWEGSSFAGSSVLETGTYTYPKGKWASYGNYGSDGTDHGSAGTDDEIDYVFTGSGDIYWNTVTLAAGGATVKTIDTITLANVKTLSGITKANTKTFNDSDLA